MGGVHSHFMWNEVLQRDGDVVDFVIRGEGEQTLPELMLCLAAGDDPAKVAGIAFNLDGVPFATPSRPFIHDLDALPTAWDLVDWEIYRFYPL